MRLKKKHAVESEIWFQITSTSYLPRDNPKALELYIGNIIYW